MGEAEFWSYTYWAGGGNKEVIALGRDIVAIGEVEIGD
jgi:hypothetical protein